MKTQVYKQTAVQKEINNNKDKETGEEDSAAVKKEKGQKKSGENKNKKPSKEKEDPYSNKDLPFIHYG